MDSRAGGAVLRLHAERERPARRTTARRAQDYSTDVLARQGDRLHPPRARAVLPLLRAGRAAPAGDPRAARPRRRRRALPTPRPNFDEARHLRQAVAPALPPVLQRAGVCTSSTATSRAASSRSLLDVDRQVGALMARSETAAVLDNTIVVYMSDNGFLWGEHRLGGKLWPYEESIRVPARDPRPVAVRRASDRPPPRAEHRPRLDDRRSSPASAAVCPRTGAASCRSCAASRRRGGDEFLEEYLGESVLSRRGAAAVPGDPHEALAVRRVPERLARALRPRHDPYELVNRARDPALAALRGRLDRRLRTLARR